MLAEAAAGWEPSWLDVALTWIVGTVFVTVIVATISLIVGLLFVLVRDAIRGDL